MSRKSRTQSEQLFEKYLLANAHTEWEFEPDFAGQTKHPDYLLRWRGDAFLFEVKELRRKRPVPPAAVHTDPYASLRAEINEAREQFRGFKGNCCSLVVMNIDDWEARLDPKFVLAAMLGDLGFAMDFDARQGRPVEATEQSAFLKHGKMRDPKSGQPQNTTVSSIIVLEEYVPPDPAYRQAFAKEVAKREANQGRRLTSDEKGSVKHDLMLQRRLSLHRPAVGRVRVIRNPFARISFPRDLFLGPYDEHWEYADSEVHRIFAGALAREIEPEDGVAGDDENGPLP
jgi:hypothetical protein